MIISNRQLNKKRMQSRGFTLIEVAASLLAFSVVVVIFASSILMAERSAHMNGQYAQALSLCQHKIDQARSVGFGQLDADSLLGAEIVDSVISSDVYSFASAGNDNVASYLSDPTAIMSIEKPYDGDTSKALVTATVTWHPTAYRNKTNTVTLAAIITNFD
ncbi:type II secretion system GspH family protein [bacterium]|nr:type II secretion system GspH family protein [bacterium]